MAQNGGPRRKVASTIVAVILVIAVTWLRSQSGHPPTLRTGNPPSSFPRLTGSYDLERDENLGGHTLHRHVGRTDQQLQERLEEERDITAASTYNDRAAAERTVAAALAQNRGRLEAWFKRMDAHPNLTLHFSGSSPIGRSLRRGEQACEPCSDALVVLRWDGDQGFHVLTTYPEVFHGR